MNKLIETQEEALEVLDEYHERCPDIVAVDTETSGLDWKKDRLFLVQVGWGWLNNYAFPIRFLQFVVPILEDSASKKVLHNIKFDAHFLEKAGVQLKGEWHDTQVMARLLLPKSAPLRLKDLASALIDSRADDSEIKLKKWMTKERLRRKSQFTKLLREHGYLRKDYEKWKKEGHLPPELEKLESQFDFEPTYEDVPKDIMEPYATGDVRYTLALYKRFMPLIQANSLQACYKRDMQTIRRVYEWEKTGWAVDIDRLEKGCQHGEERLQTLRRELNQLAEGLNPNSSAQILQFFKEQGKEIPNAQAETLQKLNHPVAQKILQIKKYEKMVGTYFKPILQKAKETGRIHGNFNVAGPVTGRFSSNNPNLQNIPKEFADSMTDIRRSFIPSDGYILVFMDYS